MSPKVKRLTKRLFDRLLLLNNPFYFQGIGKRDYVLRDQRVTLQRLRLTFQKVEGESLLGAYPFALKIHEVLGGRFAIKDGRVLLKLNGLNFSIHSSEEIFIIYEVFGLHTYRYESARRKVIMDIGMNAAIAALYFAAMEDVDRVYAYELFQPTFLIGEDNLRLNPDLIYKVERYPVGLSDRNHETTLEYSPIQKGRMGLHGLPTDHPRTQVVSEKVVLRDIADELKNILKQHENFEVIVKMDCEGSEFLLIDRLSSTKLLEHVDVFMIEWHFEAPDRIISKLKDSGFRVFSQLLPSMDSGMIYAAR